MDNRGKLLSTFFSILQYLFYYIKKNYLGRAYFYQKKFFIGEPL